MAVDEQHRASKAVGHIDQERVLFGNVRPRLEMVPAACGDQIAIFGNLPPCIAFKGQPTVEQRFDLGSCCVSTFAEEVHISIQGGDDPCEARLANWMNETVAEHIVRTDTQMEGWPLAKAMGSRTTSLASLKS